LYLYTNLPFRGPVRGCECDNIGENLSEIEKKVVRGKATYKLGGWLLSGKVGVATGPFPKQYPQSMVQVKSFVSTEEKLLLWSINGEKRSYLPSERTLQRKDPSKKSRNNFARS